MTIKSVLCIFLLTAGCAGKIKTSLEEVDLMYRYYKKAFPQVPDLSVAELVERQKKEKIILVDNREVKEREVSMIPGAITDEKFIYNMENYNDSTVVIYCTIGSRSGLLAERLRKHKINAFNLAGGVLAWAHAGKTFIDHQGQETKFVHVYGAKWNLLPKEYEAVW